MTTFFATDAAPSLLEPRHPLARPGPIPDVRVEDLVQNIASIVRRAPATTAGVYSAPTHTCGPHDTTGPCERYTSSSDTTTLPIVLGVVLPLTIALVLFIILHRRHVKKLRQEDADDKHKSLDFGMDEGVLAERKRENRKNRKSTKGANLPEMSFEEAKGALHHGRGLSIDLDLANPYILPPGLQQSRESLHSLSRSMNPEDDKYRPATTFPPGDGSMSYPSSLRSPVDDSSSFTGSSRRRFDTESNRVLLKNAQRMSRSGPPTRPESVKSAAGAGADYNNRDNAYSNAEKARMPLAPVTNNSLAPAVTDSGRESYMSTGMNSAIRASNNYLGAYIRGGENDSVATENKAPSQSTTIANTSGSISSTNDLRPLPAAVIKNDVETRRNIHDEVPSFHDQVTQKPQHTELRGGYLDVSHEQDRTSKVDPGSEREPQLPHLSLMDSRGFDFSLAKTDMKEPKQSEKTLPAAPAISISSPHHSNVPSHQEPEEEDYYEPEDYEDDLGYDPRRLTMGMRPLPPDDPSENPEQRANRIRSFYKEYFDDSKPSNPQSQVEYYDGSEEYAEDYYDEPYYNPMPPPPRGQRDYAGSERGHAGPVRHHATFSTGSFQSGPRAYSSASGQLGNQSRRAPPQKKLPPPKPLHVLPTPHKLKDDLFLPIDFAPPARYGGQRAGTPDNLRGGIRPYSPALKAANPLVSSFDDLAVMPSPHALRKSATFTGLDFAPPPRIGKGDGSGSDSGSIRSNRSAMSAAQVHSIRAGAYRVSRIPKEVAGTKDELANALRPHWDMRNM